MPSHLSGFVVLFFLLLSGLDNPSQAQQAIVLVRHAEKQDDSKDPPLSRQGLLRAQRLSEILKNLGISVIFTSQYLRTRQTAQPLSEQVHLPVQVVPADKPQELLSKIREHPKELVLVVGHSNTIGGIIKGLGCSQQIEFTENQYHRLFIVVPRPTQEPFLMEMSY